MNPTSFAHCTAFIGGRRIVQGDLRSVATAARKAVASDPHASLLVFDDDTGATVEIDLHPATDRAVDSAEAAEPPAPRGPGRPRLGVVAREVTLLPRHWDWLALQPGGASVALRRLVEEARRTHAGRDRVRRAQEATYRFMTTIAGNAPGYEEAARALFAADAARFASATAGWPADVREHAATLATAAFESK
ncbi:MAG: DUF2239 family protein, partial [Proteobacteria bacterium]|nr:DUF2239 family protein [Pseudomonadota bacterium]